MAVQDFKSKSTLVYGSVLFVLVVLSVSATVYISTIDRPNTSEDPGGEAYASSGAVRFRGGEFEFRGKPFRIVSGAIHYFRTVPADWRDRLLKLKACGMNTVETTLRNMADIYTSTGSVTFSKGEFKLSGKDFRILSGAVHYFRTLPVCWEDRLRKLKACGLNTVETYVPWNLHEEYPGNFNYEGILDIRQFIKTAQDLGLYVIVRPGPYICSEWDYGGLPAWLLKDPDMKVRSTYPVYQQAAERFLNDLLPRLVDLQHGKGGPIIAFQIENEYGSYSSNTDHLDFIRQLFIKHGLSELFITSDNLSGINKDIFYKYALPTANFKEFKEGREIFDTIHKFSPEFPLMVTEFWTGWFDHWTSQHSGLDVDEYAGYLEDILKANASINFYMFHGGTNFGFMNGANKFDGSHYKPDVTSYDYDALLSEAGDITPKYMKTRELLQTYIYTPRGETLPEVPGNSSKSTYGTVAVENYVSFEGLLNTSQVVLNSKPVAMEMLSIHGEHGQNFGYILYRTRVKKKTCVLRFSELPQDRTQIFVDGVQVGLIDWKSNDSALSVPITPTLNSKGDSLQIDILVENHGRVNYGTEESGIFDNQRKGINGSVYLNDTILDSFDVYPLEFKPNSTERSDWVSANDTDKATMSVPALFSTTLAINDNPSDTFIFMKGWGKGIVFVNKFNLGRYWSAGPQQTLYVPASVLRQGDNKIVFFEHEKLGESVAFIDRPILDVNDQSTITI